MAQGYSNMSSQTQEGMLETKPFFEWAVWYNVLEQKLELLQRRKPGEPHQGRLVASWVRSC